MVGEVVGEGMGGEVVLGGEGGSGGRFVELSVVESNGSIHFKNYYTRDIISSCIHWHLEYFIC